MENKTLIIVGVISIILIIALFNGSLNIPLTKQQQISELQQLRNTSIVGSCKLEPVLSQTEFKYICKNQVDCKNTCAMSNRQEAPGNWFDGSKYYCECLSVLK